MQDVVVFRRWAAIAAIITAVTTPERLSASSWALDEGRTQLVASLYHYETDQFIGMYGQTYPTEDYRKESLHYYAGYGLTDKLTLLGSLAQVYASQNQMNGQPDHNMGWADPAIGARYQLWRQEGFATAAEAWYLHGWRDQDNSLPEIGTPFWEAEARLFQGYGSEWQGHHWYLQGGAGYRWRGDGRADQYRLIAEAGFEPVEDWTLSARWEDLRSISPELAYNFITSAQDYDLRTGSLKLEYRWSEELRFHLGAFDVLRSRQTGKGGGLFTGVEWQF